MASSALAAAQAGDTLAQAIPSEDHTAPNEGQLGTNTGEHGASGASEAGHAETAQPENPILPTIPEFAWGAGTFIVLWALMKFVLVKPIIKTMEERSAKVRGDLEAAEAAKGQAAGALSEYDASLATARVEASRIIDDARAQADEQRKAILAAAEAEVADLRAAANAEVSQAKTEALQTLRTSVATIAVQAAEVVVQKRLDVAAQRAIVDEYLNRASQN